MGWRALVLVYTPVERKDGLLADNVSYYYDEK